MMVDYVKELRVGNKQSALADYIEQLEARVCSLWWEGMDYMGRNLYLDEHSDFNAPKEKDGV